MFDFLTGKAMDPDPASGSSELQLEDKKSTPCHSPGTTSTASSSPSTPLSLEALSLKDTESSQDPKDPTDSHGRKEDAIREARRGKKGSSKGSCSQGDYAITHTANLDSKEGQAGQPIPPLINYLVLKKNKDWALHKYAVYIEPNTWSLFLRGKLVRNHAAVFGAYIYDGIALYSPNIFATEEDLTLRSAAHEDGMVYTLHVRACTMLPPGDPMYMQLFNTIIKKGLIGMGLEEIGGKYFDHNAAFKIPRRKLELWPGFVTSMEVKEDYIVISVEITHKIIHLDSVHHLMKTIWWNNYNLGCQMDAIKEDLLDGIIITHYNRKEYKILDISWDLNPLSKFNHRGQEITFAQYYQEEYQLNIGDLTQPLLLANATMRDNNEEPLGPDGQPKPYYLVPELCHMTGLTKVMTKDIQLVKDLNEWDRSKAIKEFMDRLSAAEHVSTIPTYFFRLCHKSL